MAKRRETRSEPVWVAMTTINPEYQVPSVVYQDKEEALADGWAEDDLTEVLYWRSAAVPA